ncbi:hypothetical protein M9H77_25173 [Catharanthus roseus]|uniref:Uncharacterized protein n=1 Tax=Catharanthus roseus TaxID=4058 RepID=A0ACC0A675_CATRO|nr:hypothetical protein M9H77_25173 [Catharanthus roseus]
MENGIKAEVLDLVGKLNPLQHPYLGELYLGALEGINRQLLVDIAVIDYECILRFFDSLVDNLMNPLKMADDLEPAAMDQIKNLHEENLEERLQSKSAPVVDDRLRSEINIVYEGLVALRDDFGELFKLQNDNEKLKAALECYRDVAYQTEYFVDSSVCGVLSF